MRGRRLGLEGRLLLVGLALVLTVVALAVALVGAVDSSREQTRRARASADTLRAAERVQGLIIDLETGLRGYQLTGDPTFLDPFRRARLDVPGELRRLRLLVPRGSGRRAEVDALTGRIGAYVGGYAPRLRDDVRAGSPRVVDLTREGRRRVDEMRRRLVRLSALQEGVQELRRREADRAADRAIVVGVVGCAVALALVALSALYLRRLLVPALRGLTAAARRIAADDLDARVARRGRAELGELEAAFNSMADRLQAGQAELRRYGETNVAMLDAVFRQSPVGLAFVDPQLRYLRVNRTLASSLGQAPAEAHVGRGVSEVLPALDDPELRPFQRVLETREPVTGLEVASPPGADPALQTWWQVSFYPVVVGDALVAIGVVAVDVTTARRREEARRREQEVERQAAEDTSRLEALSTELSRALTLQEVARVSVEHLVRNVQASAGACLLADEARGLLLVEHALGDTADARRAGERLTLDAPGPPGEAFGRRRRVVRRTVGDVWEVAVPIVYGDAALGCFELRFAAADAPSAAALEAAGRMVDRCTQAIARARLFDHEHDVAQTLQRSLLPGGLPVVDGVEIDARFRPAGMGTLVGGDFYDAIVLDDASLVLVVGDVCGKGARAAAATQLVRYAIRAEAQTTREPAALLESLDAALTAELYDSDRFVTVGCATCALAGDGLDVRLSLAGSPPPLVTRSDGACAVVGRPGPVVGIGLRGFREDRFTLAAGDALLLYTDGLTDAQAPYRIDHPADLCHVLDGHANGPAPLASRLDALLDHAVGRSEVLPRDDIAVLGIRVT